MADPMNEVEQGQLLEFIAEHVCRKAPFWRRQPRRAVTVEAAPPNGIGPVWVARCACGAQTTIADVTTW